MFHGRACQIEFLLFLTWTSRPPETGGSCAVSSDVICHLIGLSRIAIFHVHGTVDPRRDILLFNQELQLNDLLFIEKRLERLEKEPHKKKEVLKMAAERDLLIRMKANLEAGRLLRHLDLTEAEQKQIASYPLLTRKALILILNVGENETGAQSQIEALREPVIMVQWIAVSARIEQGSRNRGDRASDVSGGLQLDRPALDRLTMLCYETLGLVSFFTVGPDEVRAWTNRQGSLAPQAARVIHSDIERGFIRAEVMKYQDLIKLGSEQKVKEVGKYMQRGRDYVVEDGDIINFLFNV
jgi:GTP-binding protein YchF